MSRPKEQSTTRRTLHFYWQVTRNHKGYFFGLMFSTFAFVALLTYGNPYVMSLIVDKVSAQPVEASQVFSTYGPFVLALILINVFGQAASKLQDYTLYKLEIAASYDLATMSFDALCNQSMSFHSNRFGGTLVSSWPLGKLENADYLAVFRVENATKMPDFRLENASKTL